VGYIVYYLYWSNFHNQIFENHFCWCTRTFHNGLCSEFLILFHFEIVCWLVIGGLTMKRKTLNKFTLYWYFILIASELFWFLSISVSNISWELYFHWKLWASFEASLILFQVSSSWVVLIVNTIKTKILVLESFSDRQVLLNF
jgi:hypothetical protein